MNKLLALNSIPPLSSVFGQVQAPASLSKYQGAAGISHVIQVAIQWIYIIGVVAVLVMFLWAAIQWISSGGEKEKVAAARKRITAAIIGFIILALAFLIVTFVGLILNIKLLQFNFNGPSNPIQSVQGCNGTFKAVGCGCQDNSECSTNICQSLNGSPDKYCQVSQDCTNPNTGSNKPNLCSCRFDYQCASGDCHTSGNSTGYCDDQTQNNVDCADPNTGGNKAKYCSCRFNYQCASNFCQLNGGSQGYCNTPPTTP